MLLLVSYNDSGQSEVRGLQQLMPKCPDLQCITDVLGDPELLAPCHNFHIPAVVGTLQTSRSGMTTREVCQGRQGSGRRCGCVQQN